LRFHAASHIREREIVLDLPLRSNAAERRRILVHELLHFAWVRLGNPTRNSYANLLQVEFGRRARGELGWSAEMRKSDPRLRNSKRLWREYICESFCDSGAWLYAGLKNHDEWTLKPRFRMTRAEWFRTTFPGGRIPI